MNVTPSRALLWATITMAACSSDPSAATDAGVSADRGVAVDVGDGRDWPARTEPYQAPFTDRSGAPGTIEVAASGEVLGQFGIDYSARPGRGDFVFVDGWEVRFTEILVTIGDLRLDGRGPNPDQQERVGAPVAGLARAFAIDLQKPGPLGGIGGPPETAHPLHVFARADNGAALDAQMRYAFSFAFEAARPDAVNVNLGESQQLLYRRMIERGWSTLLRGRARYRGVAAQEATLREYPSEVGFEFGFGAPARYINCDNQENSVRYLRGVQPNATRSVRAQVTFHADHVFWSELGIEHPPLRFDPFAARVAGLEGDALLEMDALATVAPTNLRDRLGRAVPDRAGQTMGAMVPNPAAVSFAPNGVSSVRDLRDFLAYSTRAAGHLNGEGLCFVRPISEFLY